MTGTGSCQERIYAREWGASSHACGRPIKADGLCGLHLSVRNRAHAKSVRREQAMTAADQQRREMDQNAAALKDRFSLTVEVETLCPLTGVEAYISRPTGRILVDYSDLIGLLGRLSGGAS